jgi:methionyl aminopeptidase
MQSERRHIPRSIARPDYADHIEGFPASEAAARSNRDIRALSPAEQEKMRVVCRVRRFGGGFSCKCCLPRSSRRKSCT